MASILVPALARIEVWSRHACNTKRTYKSLLHALEFEMLSSMGVNKHVKVEWHTIAREFRGIGLYSLSVEQFICWLEMILQHYQAGHTVSSKLRATLEALQLELGCRGNPLDKDYSAQGILATDAWITLVWERTWNHNFCIYLDYPVQPYPRD